MKSRSKLRIDWVFLCGTALIILMYLMFHLITGKSPFAPSGYNTYTRQAMAWRQGLLHLPQDVPHLELAVFQGDYYVSFPPLPSVPLFLLTFIFGMDTPDALMVKLYVYAAFAIVYFLYKKIGMKPIAALIWSLLTVYASSMLPLTLDGAVWYQAQTLAFMLIMGSVSLMVRRKTCLSLLLFALAIGCRPNDAPYLLVLLAMHFYNCKKDGQSFAASLRALLPGIACGILVAVCYGAYNYVRFGSPLEFGHGYLPEFTRDNEAFFDMSRIAGNSSRFLIGLPFSHGGASMEIFGFSLFIANPITTVTLLYMLLMLIKKRLDWRSVAVIIAICAEAVMLLSTHNGGGFQYGARYFVDLIPYSAVVFALCPLRTQAEIGDAKAYSFGALDAFVLLTSLAFAVYGSLMVAL
ncbi:MAG: hypothetical protein PHU22_03305 [Eubacteriales bacterium]|nr:hypothetical protein [Eubacteriales bacterium]